MNMKKNALFLLIALALAFSLLMTGCGQKQASAELPENDAETTLSVDDANAPAEKTSTPEDGDTQPPEDVSAKEQDTDEDVPGSEGPAPADDTPKADTPANEENTSVPPTEQVSESAPASTSELEPPQETMPASETVPETAAEVPTTSESTPVATDTVPETTEEPAATSNTNLSGTDLTLRFGGGETFTIHMYDNTTAAKIAEYVGTASWQLPIYHYDDYDGWESFQYYDIPSRYDIPSNAESITSEKAGVVYYSHPNRIILFYQDAAISTEYTPVGYIDFSQDLVDAVENNPVVEGWGNKLVFIQP